MYTDSDPKRIPKIIDLLSNFWTRNPGMSLCQIISNVAMREGTEDPFFIPDDVAKKNLKDMIKEGIDAQRKNDKSP